MTNIARSIRTPADADVANRNVRRVSQQIIAKTQRAYLREFMWLLDARLDSADKTHPTCFGRFRIPAATYTKTPQRYVGCPEAIVCVNQLACVAWAELLEEGLVDCQMTPGQFMDLPPSSMNMFDIRRLRFKKALPKDKEFEGAITLDSYRPGDLTIVVAAFTIGDGAIVGEGSFVISSALGDASQ